MLIHVAVASGTPKSAVRREEFLAMHARSLTPLHVLTPDAEASDLIVLAGDFETLDEAQANSLLKLYPEKTMIYSEIDALIPFAPGVYGSAYQARGLDLHRMQSNIYLSRYGSSLNPEIRLRASEPKDLLFCFRGRRDCRVRADLLDYPYNRADIEVLERTGFMHWKEGAMGGRQAQKDYADALARSHFALCPRGMGFGSIRLFEVMEMGIAPVLLADRYALPPGPDWKSFLVQVQERQVDRLPAILDALVTESEERGRKARQAWEMFFAPEFIANRIIDQFLQIRAQRRIPERLYRNMWPLLQLRANTRITLSSAIRKSVASIRSTLRH